MAVFSVLLVWSLVSVVTTLALGHWLSRADAAPSFRDDDLRISR